MVNCRFIIIAVLVTVVSIMIKILPLSDGPKLSLGFSKNSFQNFTERTSNDQYISEEHTVITEDGYVLTVFRMAEAKKCNQKNQRPVLVLHGLIQNSDVFLDAGSAGLAYLLSDACFDMWFGNLRGNNYGRQHLTWNPDKDAEFWQFSIDEIAFYDVPAIMDYILNQTGADKVNYVGYSQGGGIFFAMCSERPDYCKKTGVMVALAPTVILDHTKSFLLRGMIKSVAAFQRILKLLGVHEVFNKGCFLQKLLDYVCQVGESIWIEKLCMSGAFLDNFSESISSNTWRVIFSNVFVGTSLNNFVRYGQVMDSGKFQKFDYGEKMNLNRYNNSLAPEYNLTTVSAPVVIIQGRSDNMVDIADTYILATKLPNVVDMTVVADPKWTHLDIIYSQNIKTMVYPKMYEYLQKYRDFEDNSTF